MSRQESTGRRVFANDTAQRWIASVCGLMMSATAIFLIHGTEAGRAQGLDAELTRWFVTVLALITLVSVVNAFLRTASLELDDYGIRYILFGRARRSIAWKDVKRIRIMEATPLASFGEPIVQYFVDATTEFRLPYTGNGPVFFTSRIGNSPELIAIVEDKARAYGVPVVDSRRADT